MVLAALGFDPAGRRERRNKLWKITKTNNAARLQGGGGKGWSGWWSTPPVSEPVVLPGNVWQVTFDCVVVAFFSSAVDVAASGSRKEAV